LLLTLRPELGLAQNFEQLSFLHSPFRPRQLNPHSWDEKEAFWRGLIVDFLSGEKTCLTLKGSFLQQKLSCKRLDGKLAEGLPEVLQRLALERRDIVEVEVFKREHWSLGWKLASALGRRLFGGDGEEVSRNV